MTRAIDSTLTLALGQGTGKPILVGYIGYDNGNVVHSEDIIHYKLTGTTLEFEMHWTGDVTGDQESIWLKRGLSIAGVEYTLTTGRFRIQSEHYLINDRQVIKATLFPTTHYSALGHGTYKTVIDAFCTAHGKTAVYRDPAAAWLNYTFLPLDTYIVLEDANAFLAMLRQKYLIFMADKGNEEVLVYSCAGGLGPAPDLAYLYPLDFFIQNTRYGSRRFIWRDELGTVHTSGLATYPAHNLGFMWSTAAAPSMNIAPSVWQRISRPDLRPLDGDIISVSAFSATHKGFALVTEEYTAPDKSHPHPRWTTTITSNEVFGNTAGGSIPQVILQANNYTPLNTSAFDGILSANENNVQTAMDRLDDHSHPITLPAHGLNGTLSAGATLYTPPFYYGLQTSRFNFTAPQSGRLALLSMWTNSAQPASGTLVVTVAVNNAASALTITVPAGSVSSYFQDITHTVSLAAGDTVSIDLTNNAAAASAQVNSLTICYYPDSP